MHHADGVAWFPSRFCSPPPPYAFTNVRAQREPCAFPLGHLLQAWITRQLFLVSVVCWCRARWPAERKRGVEKRWGSRALASSAQDPRHQHPHKRTGALLPSLVWVQIEVFWQREKEQDEEEGSGSGEGVGMRWCVEHRGNSDLFVALLRSSPNSSHESCSLCLAVIKYIVDGGVRATTTRQINMPFLSLLFPPLISFSLSFDCHCLNDWTFSWLKLSNFSYNLFRKSARLRAIEILQFGYRKIITCLIFKTIRLKLRYLLFSI